MDKRRKRQIRIIKHGTANNVLVSQAAITEREERANDPMEPLIRGISGWVNEFKERPRTDPRITFQALFKEV